MGNPSLSTPDTLSYMKSCSDILQFWELDTDHDFFICKEDLLRYGNHSLTYRIVDRIFSQVTCRTQSKSLCSAQPCRCSPADFTPGLAWKDLHSWTALQAARPFASKTDGKMGYEDFVYFILSEEDKTNNISLDYWFKCIDLDCDGCLRANEMLVQMTYHKLCLCIAVLKA